VVSITTLSAVEQIAQDIEDWGDGWLFLWDPDDRGDRARLSRWHEDKDDIRIELEIYVENGVHFVFAGCEVRGGDGGWTPVSVSVRNPITRKALDHINARLDEIER
jgi:hypothetical protein